VSNAFAQFSFKTNDLMTAQGLRYHGFSIDPKLSNQGLFKITVSKFAINPTLPRAFFCRIEDNLDRKSPIGLRFRLGSVLYTDYLEGKTNSNLLISK
jgi:hypothetical protein